MPQNVEVAAFVLGAVLLLLALTTSGFKIFGAEMSATSGRWSRSIAGISGVALIGFALWQGLQPEVVIPQAPLAAPSSSPQLLAPHAPELNVAQGVQIWGEDTKLLSIAPGEDVTLLGRDLFADALAVADKGGCIGPAFIAYTWQVREPYPKGGDLAITSIVMGGSRPLVGRGSMGEGQMSECDEHTFKNNGLEPIKVEVRYGTYIDQV